MSKEILRGSYGYKNRSSRLNHKGFLRHELDQEPCLFSETVTSLDLTPRKFKSSREKSTRSALKSSWTSTRSTWPTFCPKMPCTGWRRDRLSTSSRPWRSSKHPSFWLLRSMRGIFASRLCLILSLPGVSSILLIFRFFAFCLCFKTTP